VAASISYSAFYRIATVLAPQFVVGYCRLHDKSCK